MSKDFPRNKSAIKIVFIGGGNIAHSLVPALINAGYIVDLILSKNLESARKLAEKNDIIKYSDQFNRISDDNNFIILSVPDSQIRLIAENLAVLNINFTNKIFVHLSGSKTIDELSPLDKKDAGVGSLHIMQTFPEREVFHLDSCPASIETNDQIVKEVLIRTAKDLELNPFEINSWDKISYHLMGVFTSNFLVGNFFNAELISGNVDSPNMPKPEELLYLTTKQTLDNIRRNGTLNSLSGPVARGDLQTVQNHTEKLKETNHERGKLNLPLLNYLTQSYSLCVLLEQKESSKTSVDEIKNYLLREFKKMI